MNPRHYFQIALVIPFVPLLIGYGSLQETNTTSMWYVQLFGFSYIPFALLLLAWMRNKPAGAMHRMSYRAPILFMWVEIALFFLYSFFGTMTDDEFIAVGMLVFISIFIISLFGYLYVLLVEIGYLYLIKADKNDKNKQGVGGNLI
jgi:hypothetical protein